MKRKLRALGLGLIAALAMSAVAASAAQANTSEFTAAAYPAVIQGEQEPLAENYFEATPGSEPGGGEKVECDVAEYEATLNQASESLTVTPHYAGCNRHVRLNGCHFEFTTAGTTNNGVTPGEAGVRCPGGGQIEVGATVFGSEICTVDLPEQHGLTGVTFTQKDSDTVTVDVNIKDQIKYTDTDRSFCPFAGTVTREDGDFVSEVEVDGFGDLGHNTTSTGTTGYVEGGARNVHIG